MRIKITADSTCDLPKSIARDYGVQLIPLYVNLGGTYRRDGVDLTVEEIYDYVEKTGTLCTTAAVNVEDYTEIFRRLRQDYDAVIHFTISASMSSCYQNAKIAGDAVGGVWVVDSETLSSGIGLLVIEASLMAQRGDSPDAIFAEVNRLKKKLDVSFVLDTTEYLRKGGRCSAIASLGANLLRLRPCIAVKNGAMGMEKKYRGNLEKCFETYVRERLTDIDTLDLRRIFITCSSENPERAAYLTQVVQECAPFAQILTAQAGSTICSHCGPNCMGILFFRK